MWLNSTPGRRARVQVHCSPGRVTIRQGIADRQSTVVLSDAELHEIQTMMARFTKHS
ncbi:hypothetical protein GS534_13245 [Rhodococcus hoagii]|nr:hypothetical protein [Prescottella equi]